MSAHEKLQEQDGEMHEILNINIEDPGHDLPILTLSVGTYPSNMGISNIPLAANHDNVWYYLPRTVNWDPCYY